MLSAFAPERWRDYGHGTAARPASGQAHQTSSSTTTIYHAPGWMTGGDQEIAIRVTDGPASKATRSHRSGGAGAGGGAPEDKAGHQQDHQIVQIGVGVEISTPSRMLTAKRTSHEGRSLAGPESAPSRPGDHHHERQAQDRQARNRPLRRQALVGAEQGIDQAAPAFCIRNGISPVLAPCPV